MDLLQIVGAAVAAAGFAWLVRGALSTRKAGTSEHKAKVKLDAARKEAEELVSEAKSRKDQMDTLAKEEVTRIRREGESELKTRRAEIAKLEERMLQKEESLDAKTSDMSRREQAMKDRERNIEQLATELKEKRRDHIHELEKVAGLTAAQAKQALMTEIEQDLRHESGKMIRRIEEETKHEAERRSRNILAACMQRIAAGYAAETTVSLVNLASDDLKGRIIGKEGRNIRTLESLTGVDIIIDETPQAVVLSSFDGVRREIAKVTLEKLLQDGRVHPARIEEMYYQAKSEIENHIIEAGEQATFEVDVHPLHPELVKMLGRMKYRTSYGQNLLAHSIECAKLAALLASEMGASPKTAKRAALLHDIGKVASQDSEGPHAQVGAEIARRYKEPEAVVHAIASHHNEVGVQTVEDVIVQITDSLSGGRPGARGESLEQYITRLKDLEDIARAHSGVDNVYAIQAGRELRVIVSPDSVDDNVAAALSHEIASEIEEKLDYPGQIKVTVIRESRSVGYAK